MITWIQTILQKHHKYVFSILLVVIIIAFVFTIGSSIPFFGDRNPSYDTNKQDFYGWNLRDQNVVQRLYMGTYYDMLLSGRQAQSEEQMQSAILSRALLLSMAKKMNVPTASEQEYVNYIQAQPAFRNTDGTFSQEKLNLFISQHSAMGEATLNSLLLENVTVAKLRNLFAGAGFVQESQVESNYNLLNSKYTFSVASLDLANFNPEIVVDEAKISEFYETNKARYQVAEEISLQVAFFPVSEFANAEITATEEELLNFYNKQKALFMVEKDGKQSLESFDVAKAKVEAEYKKAQILRSAMQKAQEFSDLVYDAETTFNSDAFKAILADAKVTLKQVPAYRATDQQFTKDFPIEILRAGLELGGDNWFYNEIIASEEGAYVVFLDAIRPSYIPTLTDIRIQIERDYKAAETYALFSAKATALEASLQAGLKDSKSFDEVAVAEGAKIENITDFSFAKQDEAQVKALGNAASLLDNLATLKANEMSDMALLDGNAYIFYVSKVEAPVLDKDSQEYKNLAGYMQVIYSMRSLSAFVNEKERAFQMLQTAQ